VHLSGGVGIGGVLEPLQANPTIIEDNCFIGARSEVVEGVIVGENSVISMGVYHRPEHPDLRPRNRRSQLRPHPARFGGRPATCPKADGKLQPLCAIIVKKVDAKTRAKTSINELLRGD
jgi:2,3,4,5-tetrahydropyridine-2-carboxylate N-succinyltransferase